MLDYCPNCRCKIRFYKAHECDKMKHDLADSIKLAGDVIASGENNEIRHIVTYLESEAKYVGYYSKDDYCGIDQKWIDEFKKAIIGNIYDNPELNYK